jgi:hypothetical protein
MNNKSSKDESIDIVIENVETALKDIESTGHCDLSRGDVIWLRQILEERTAVETDGCRYPMSYGKRCAAYPDCVCGRSAVVPSGPTAVADGFEEVLRVEIASDTPGKVARFRKELCNLILDAPAAGNHDVMVMIHRDGSIPVFETHRTPGNELERLRTIIGDIHEATGEDRGSDDDTLAERVRRLLADLRQAHDDP